MDSVDAALLRMDCASNLMLVIGVWIFRPAIAYGALFQRLQDRLLAHPRFFQRVEQDATGAIWVHDRNFDLRRHLLLERLAVRADGAQRALQDRLAELAMLPLDPDRPLWQFHLIERYQGGSALLLRIHHCIGDGMALLAVARSLMDGHVPSTAPVEGSGETDPGLEAWISDKLVRPLADASVRAIDLAANAATATMGLIADPRSVFDRGLAGSERVARLVYQVLHDAAALALMDDDSPSRLKGEPGHTKRVAWCAGISLDDLKAVGTALGCSVNDIMLSCVAGALRSYLGADGDASTDREMRAMVPVNLREPGPGVPLGNRFGLAPVLLPVGIDHPLERLYEIRRRMLALKGSMQPLLAYWLLAAAGLLGKQVEDAIVGVFANKTTAVITNVVGPREPLQLLGASLVQGLFWVPQSASVALGVSIFSYSGRMQFGIISDSVLCPDPDSIAAAIEPEFAKLAMLSLMLPPAGGDGLPHPPAPSPKSAGRRTSPVAVRRRPPVP